MDKYTKSEGGLWVPQPFAIRKPSRRDVLRAGALAAGAAVFPKQAKATSAWTYLRSTSIHNTTGSTSGDFPDVDTSDADLAVVTVAWMYTGPNTFAISDNLVSGFAYILGVSVSSLMIGLQEAQILTGIQKEMSHTFHWSTGGTGAHHAATIALFSGTPIWAVPEVTYDPGQAGSLTAGSITPYSSDALVVVALAKAEGDNAPTAINGGYTAFLDTSSAACNASWAYLIQPSPSATAPTWTASGGLNVTNIVSFVPVGGAAPASIRHSIRG